MAPGARIGVEAESLVHRGGIASVDPAVYREVASTLDEHVLERTGFPGDRALATVSGPAGEVRLEWSAHTLPHLFSMTEVRRLAIGGIKMYPRDGK